MNDYAIRQLVARGPGKTDSIIDLKPGVNVVLGPSNTGKSMIVNCIDYLFGGDKVPFIPDETGYDTIRMTLTNDEGESLVVSRDIETNDGEAAPSSTVFISSTIEEVDSGVYQTRLTKKAKDTTYGDILLGLLGIKSRYEIISTQAGKYITLTPRVFFHLLCLKEGEIFKEKSVIENASAKGNTITTDINALAFLLYEGGIATKKFEDPKIKEAKKTAVVAYIGDKSSTLKERQEYLRAEIDKAGKNDIETAIESILAESTNIENKITEARSKSQAMLSEIFAVSKELEESRFLQERYHKLHTQYDADLQRLHFIVEGETNSEATNAEHCPFCDARITSASDRKSYIQASKAEMVKVRQQLADLSELEDELTTTITQLNDNLASLHQNKSSVQELISMSFQPKMNELRSELKNYQTVVNMKQELTLLDAFTKEFQGDMYDKLVQDQEDPKFDAKKAFSKEYLRSLGSALKEAVKECKYPEFKTAGISEKHFDVIVNNRDKKDEGKGYRAFLNTIFAFTIMKYIEANGRHAPKMLILDSPILSLKESDEVQVSDSMKTALLKYLIKNCGSCQLIIAENELPSGVDYGDVNCIEFTQGRKPGRYGFLKDFTGTISDGK